MTPLDIVKIYRETGIPIWDIESYKLIHKSKMKTITLENGQKVEISEESYNALAKAVQKELTWADIYDKYIEQKNKRNDGAKMLKKLHAINKLLITSKYLNGDWTPDWEDIRSDKWYVYINGNKLFYDYSVSANGRIAYFKSKELAQRAIDILGEEVIKTALGN